MYTNNYWKGKLFIFFFNNNNMIYLFCYKNINFCLSDFKCFGYKTWSVCLDDLQMVSFAVFSIVIKIGLL